MKPEFPVETLWVVEPLHSTVETVIVSRTNEGRYMLTVWNSHGFDFDLMGTHAEVWNRYHRTLSEG
jgi:hypothetical protein